jgi:cytochrome c6
MTLPPDCHPKNVEVSQSRSGPKVEGSGMKVDTTRIRVFTTLDAGLVIGALLLVTTASAATGDKRSANDTGRAAFKANCVSCHGADGAGTPLGKSMQAPDLRSPEVQKKADGDLAQTITEGRGDMPSFKRILNGEQVQAVIDYVRRLRTN